MGDGVGVAAGGFGAGAFGGGVGVGVGRRGVAAGAELAVGVEVAVGGELAAAELADVTSGAITGELADATVTGAPEACPGALLRGGLAATACCPELPAAPAAGDVALVVYGDAGES